MKVVGDKSSNEADYHTEYQEPRTIFSSNNKRRKLNLEVDVSVSQLNWGIGDESRMIETDLNTVKKQPILSMDIWDATKSKELLKVANPTPPFVDKSAVNVVHAVPVRSVAPSNYTPIDKIGKEKSVKRGATNQQLGKAKKVSTIEDIQKPKRGQKRSTKAMEEAK